MSQIVVQTQNLTKTFGDVVAVDQLKLTVRQGQFVALLGPSGCGKTTTLRLLAGFEAPDQGSVEIGGVQVAGPGRMVPPEKRKVGMVFQSYALFPHLTVGQNVAYGLDKAANRAGGVQEALELVQLAHLESRMPHELSGGQQQRVALARALAPKPALILLDEPFSNLDAGLRATVRAEVRDILRMAETTALFVTHDQAEALSLCDQVAVMIDGQIAQMAPPHILYQHPASKAVAAFVGDANFLPGTCQTDGQVECELGRFAVTKSLSGEVEIMLRPEAIRLTLNDQGQGVIIDRHYFGHEQVLICCLDSGTLIRVRLSGLNQHFVLGRRVDFSLTGDAVVFPR